MISVFRAISRILGIVSVVLVTILCLPICYEALLRAADQPTIWVFEVTLYAFIFLGFLGNTVAVRKNAHFRVTVITKIFPTMRRFFDLLSNFMASLFALLIVGSGCYFVWYSIENEIVSATLLEIPMWIPQLAIPLGGLGLLLETIIQIIEGAPQDEDEFHVGD